jgi:hypothetical protein
VIHVAAVDRVGDAGGDEHGLLAEAETAFRVEPRFVARLGRPDERAGTKLERRIEASRNEVVPRVAVVDELVRDARIRAVAR